MKEVSIYFSVNGDYGCGGYSKPEFPELKDYLAHMDRLGISYSIVSNTESRDYSVYHGNKRLLQDIDSCNTARDRIFPALTISPAMYYENGAMDFLKQCLETGRVKVLKIFPSVSRFEIFQIEQVLRDVAKYKPILIIDTRFLVNKLSYKGIAELAKLFPEINIICTQVVWGSLQSVMELMWRCDNVYIDTSWLHVKSSIELIAKSFGLHRILYGCGPKYHNGASIAALAHARLSDAAKEQIAYKNIMKLMGVQSLPKMENIDLKATNHEKPFWNKFKTGGRIEGIDVIDAHTHIGAPARGWMIEKVEISEQVEDIINTMDRLGITRMISCPEEAQFANPLKGNRKTEESIKAFKEYKNRIIGYLVFNPHYSQLLIPELDNLFKSGFFRGFKILSDYWNVPVTDPRYNAIWEYADKYHLPILIHTWDGYYSNPSLFKDIVPKYPNAKFILGHSGGGDKGRPEAEKLVISNPNVYLEWCGSFLCTVPWEETISRVGNKQIVFGTDTYFHEPAWEIGRLLSLDIADDELIPILGSNMKKILDDIVQKLYNLP
jgi:predicted TIM-barrel fold metal-dependent hydrolase